MFKLAVALCGVSCLLQVEARSRATHRALAPDVAAHAGDPQLSTKTNTKTNQKSKQLVLKKLPRLRQELKKAAAKATSQSGAEAQASCYPHCEHYHDEPGNMPSQVPVMPVNAMSSPAANLWTAIPGHDDPNHPMHDFEHKFTHDNSCVHVCPPCKNDWGEAQSACAYCNLCKQQDNMMTSTTVKLIGTEINRQPSFAEQEAAGLVIQQSIISGAIKQNVISVMGEAAIKSTETTTANSTATATYSSYVLNLDTSSMVEPGPGELIVDVQQIAGPTIAEQTEYFTLNVSAISPSGGSSLLTESTQSSGGPTVEDTVASALINSPLSFELNSLLPTNVTVMILTQENLPLLELSIPAAETVNANMEQEKIYKVLSDVWISMKMKYKPFSSSSSSSSTTTTTSSSSL